MRHLHALPLKATLHIKAFVGFRAVQNGFVASNVVGNVVHGVYYPQTKLLALLISRDRYVFNVAYKAQVSNTDHFS